MNSFKPLLTSLAAATLLASTLGADSMYERFEAMEKEMQKLKAEIASLKGKKTLAAVKNIEVDEEGSDDEEGDYHDDELEERIDDIEESIAEINRNTAGSHLKFNVDYRFAIENMHYKMADGSKADNDAFMTNRIWLNMGYQATNNLSFAAQLAYNKAFGARSGSSDPRNGSFETFDWISNENAFDDQLRVRSAYIFYKDMEFMGYDIPWTFSIGRRPSTDGHLVNLRDDTRENSPLGHSINVEFDGLSSSFMLNKETGTYVKLCAGRGMSNASPRFSSTPYSKNSVDNSSIDLAGLSLCHMMIEPIKSPLSTTTQQIL